MVRLWCRLRGNSWSAAGVTLPTLLGLFRGPLSAAETQLQLGTGVRTLKLRSSLAR